MASKWETKLIIDIEGEDIKHSLILKEKITRNMYLYDIQFKLLHSRVATNKMLFKMQISEKETSKFCLHYVKE